MVGKCKLLQFTQDKFDSAHWSVFFWCNTVRAYMSNIPGLSQSSNDQMFITTFFMCFLHDIKQTAEAAQKALGCHRVHGMCKKQTSKDA